MSRSKKPQVVERIYDSLVDPVTGQLTRRQVTMEDVDQALDWCTINLGLARTNRNVANFFKDIIRGKGANGMWPQKLKHLRITARQSTGDGNCFEFLDYEPSQTEPFPTHFLIGSTPTHLLQSISMSLRSKDLGRDDETYLIQVAVKLQVVETHLALHSPLDVIELDHLQVGVKLRRTELDSVYSGVYLENGVEQPLLVTVEAKGRGQRVLREQIVNQIKAAFELVPNVSRVVPVAMSIVKTASGESGIHFIEFHSFTDASLVTEASLLPASQQIYVLRPPVKGI